MDVENDVECCPSDPNTWTTAPLVESTTTNTPSAVVVSPAGATMVGSRSPARRMTSSGGTALEIPKSCNAIDRITLVDASEKNKRSKRGLTHKWDGLPALDVMMVRGHVDGRVDGTDTHAMQLWDGLLTNTTTVPGDGSAASDTLAAGRA